MNFRAESRPALDILVTSFKSVSEFPKRHRRFSLSTSVGRALERLDNQANIKTRPCETAYYIGAGEETLTLDLFLGKEAL
jgi:hypothetical protein